MEIKELVSYYLGPESNILEVSFRTIEDSEDSIRMDNIDYSIVEEYGYELESETFDFFGTNEDEEDFGEIIREDTELDEDELKNFLNEYYAVNPDKVPLSEPY